MAGGRNSGRHVGWEHAPNTKLIPLFLGGEGEQGLVSVFFVSVSLSCVLCVMAVLPFLLQSVCCVCVSCVVGTDVWYILRHRKDSNI